MKQPLAKTLPGVWMPRYILALAILIAGSGLSYRARAAPCDDIRAGYARFVSAFVSKWDKEAYKLGFSDDINLDTLGAEECRRMLPVLKALREDIDVTMVPEAQRAERKCVGGHVEGIAEVKAKYDRRIARCEKMNASRPDAPSVLCHPSGLIERASEKTSRTVFNQYETLWGNNDCRYGVRIQYTITNGTAENATTETRWSKCIPAQRQHADLGIRTSSTDTASMSVTGNVARCEQ
ncbi:hypothetical protein [Bradyrhizobium guangdongense]|uniref:hypothetical protein n=1 Tax=Bradyrhizobium guangdongense TaxID=1325090 RepID=UPI00112BE794|nr:hypothetical protein [Bradyrhizobium guangdongense]